MRSCASAAAGAAGCVLTVHRLVVVGEGGSPRSPVRRLRMVGVRHRSGVCRCAGAHVFPSVVWAARCLTLEASVLQVWSPLPPRSVPVIVCISPWSTLANGSPWWGSCPGKKLCLTLSVPMTVTHFCAVPSLEVSLWVALVHHGLLVKTLVWHVPDRTVVTP